MFDPILDVLKTFGTYFLQILICIPCGIIAVSARNYVQGITAYLLGDKSIKETGRLSLNPIKHIDPVGFLCLALFRFGWASPVPYNKKNFKHPKLGVILIFLVGTLANLIVGFIFTFILCLMVYRSGNTYPVYAAFVDIPFKLFGEFGTKLGSFAFDLTVNIIQSCCMLNLTIMVFSFIPLPPLDGFSLLSLILPKHSVRMFWRNEQYFSLGLLVVLFIDRYFTGYVNFAFGNAVNFFIEKCFQPIIEFIIY